jgi:hypothetical protein
MPLPAGRHNTSRHLRGNTPHPEIFRDATSRDKLLKPLLALSGGAMSAIAPLMGVDQTSIRPIEIDANDPNRSLVALKSRSAIVSCRS